MGRAPLYLYISPPPPPPSFFWVVWGLPFTRRKNEKTRVWGHVCAACGAFSFFFTYGGPLFYPRPRGVLKVRFLGPPLGCGTRPPLFGLGLPASVALGRDFIAKIPPRWTVGNFAPAIWAGELLSSLGRNSGLKGRASLAAPIGRAPCCCRLRSRFVAGG